MKKKIKECIRNKVCQLFVWFVLNFYNDEVPEVKRRDGLADLKIVITSKKQYEEVILPSIKEDLKKKTKR